MMHCVGRMPELPSVPKETAGQSGVAVAGNGEKLAAGDGAKLRARETNAYEMQVKEKPRGCMRVIAHEMRVDESEDEQLQTRAKAAAGGRKS